MQDPPQHYSPPRLLTVSLSDPPQLPPGFNDLTRYQEQRWNREAMMTLLHLRAMQQQLLQVQQAMALALLTGRALVLPRLSCFCFKGWFAHALCRWACMHACLTLPGGFGVQGCRARGQKAAWALMYACMPVCLYACNQLPHTPAQPCAQPPPSCASAGYLATRSPSSPTPAPWTSS